MCISGGSLIVTRVMVRFAWHLLSKRVQNGAQSRSRDLHLSMIGNPEDRFNVEDRSWSYTMLNFYMRYAWACQFIDFDSIDSVVELGSGSGKQAEVWANLHPHLTLFLFDIPPQSPAGRQLAASPGVASLMAQPMMFRGVELAPGGAADVPLPLPAGRWSAIGYTSTVTMHFAAEGRRYGMPAYVGRPGAFFNVGSVIGTGVRRRSLGGSAPSGHPSSPETRPTPTCR